MSAGEPRPEAQPAAAPRPVVRQGVFPWLPWPLRAMPSWTTPIRAERLAALRIGLAFFLLLDVLTSYWPNREVFFGPDSLGTFDQYEYYATKGRHWWSVLRGPANDLNFTVALLGALGLAVWIVLDTRTRLLGDDPAPPHPSPWLTVLFAGLSAYALSGWWVRILSDKKLLPQGEDVSLLRSWMWLAPLILFCFSVVIWGAEAWANHQKRLAGMSRPPHGYLMAWYVLAFGWFPLLTACGYLLHRNDWTEPNDGADLVRTLLEPWLLDHGMITAGLVIWIIALVFLLVGFQTRVAAVSAWIFSTSFANVQPHIDNAGDVIRGIILFYLLLCPCGAAWSVDRLLARRRPPGALVVVSPWPVRLLFLQLLFIYFMNGLYKIFSEEWREGQMLYYVLNDLTLTRFSYSQLPLTYPMTQFLTWSVLAWELTFPLMVLWRYTRILALIFGAGFHLGIGFSLDLGFFVPYTLCIYLPFLPWEWLADRRRRA